MRSNENTIVKDSLTEALLLLMETTEYSQITITTIAKKAGVSRMAYYRNFHTKEDILAYYFDRSCKELYASTDISTDTPLIKSVFQYIYALFTEKKAVILALKKANLTYLLLDHFDHLVFEGRDIVLENNIELVIEPISTYHPYFFSGAFYNYFMKWFDNGMQESYDEIMKIVTALIPETNIK